MTFGNYLTSFLRIYINTNLPLDNLKSEDLADYEKAIFLHEYTHFLQNITGAFGHLHAWNTYDRIRQHLADQEVVQNPLIQLPFTGEVAEEQERYKRIRTRMIGSYKLRDGMDDSTSQIESLRFRRDQDVAIIHPNTPVHHLVLSLIDGNGNTMEYTLGEAAVSEAMAMLMETKHFQLDPPPNLPYNVCHMLTQHMNANFMDNIEFLFALCDVSMLSSYPGITFYRILQDMQLRDFTPNSAEQVIDYGLNFLYQRGWNVWEDYQTSMEGTCHVLQTLLTDPVLTPTVNWVVYLFHMGFHCRRENPYFMVRLYREPVVYEGLWNNVVAQFGTPEMHNNSPIRYFRAPLDLQEETDNILPITMLALNEVQLTLFNGKCECDLYDFCRRSTNGLLVDERCVTSPWLRAQDNPTCAYGAVWTSFGLCEKQVRVNIPV